MKTENDFEKIQNKIKEVEKQKQNLTKNLDKELDSLKKELSSKKIDLEKRFNQFLYDSGAKISEHLALAQIELEKAIQISEETGLPFDTEPYLLLRENVYVPSTLRKLKTEFSDEVVNNFLNDHNYPNQSGWRSEGWSFSSLSC